MFNVVRLLPTDIASQYGGNSCSMLCIGFVDNIIQGLAIRDRITQKKIKELWVDAALQIFLNSTNLGIE